MWQHALEVWLLLVAAFVLGCLLGVMLHRTVGAGRHADRQYGMAYAVGATVDELGSRMRGSGSGRLGYEPDDRSTLDSTDGPIETGELSGTSASSTRPTSVSEDVDDRRGDGFPSRLEPDGAGSVIPEDDAARLAPASALAAETQPGQMTVEPSAGDRLVQIRGVGKRTAERLNQLGIYRFAQIAAWTREDVEVFAERLGPGVRPEHDDWVGQAAELAAQAGKPDRT
jgi:predicted flap endonuclease-1-like 5' DNA nuclease